MYEKKITELIKQLEFERARSESAGEQVDIMKKLISDNEKSIKVLSYIWILSMVFIFFSLSPYLNFHILTL